MKSLQCPDCKGTNHDVVRPGKYHCRDCYRVFEVPMNYMISNGTVLKRFLTNKLRRLK